MTPSQRLIARIRTELDFDLSPSAGIKRLRPGRHQLAAGAWKWYLQDDSAWDGRVGSDYPVKELLGAGFLEFYRHPHTYDVTILPRTG